MQALLFGPFLNEPLERDEGAYAYIAQRLSAGELPYRDIYDHKPPAVYFIYAAIFKLMGQSILSIRLFTLFYCMLTTLSLFAVGYLLWGRIGGMLSALLYAFFSGGPYIQGTSANTETFMVLPMVLALYCFLRGTRDGGRGTVTNLFLAGIFSGLAVMIKQVAVANFLVLVGFAGLISLIPLLLGFTTFPLIFTLFFWLRGALPDFINAMLFENLAYVAGKTFRWGGFFRTVTRENLILWLLVIFSTAYILFRERKPENLLLSGWAIFSVLGVVLGRSFYGHYFIQAIPGLVLMSSYALLKLSRHSLSAAAGMLVFLFLTLPVLSSRYPFHFMSGDEISVQKYGIYNFVLAKEAAQFIRQKSSGNNTIYVWGAEPEIYFYSQRRAASKFIYFYPLLENSGRGKERRLEMMGEMRQNSPQYIILADAGVGYPVLFDLLKTKYRFLAKIDRWQIWEIKK